MRRGATRPDAPWRASAIAAHFMIAGRSYDVRLRCNASGRRTARWLVVDRFPLLSMDYEPASQDAPQKGGRLLPGRLTLLSPISYLSFARARRRFMVGRARLSRCAAQTRPAVLAPNNRGVRSRAITTPLSRDRPRFKLI